jgi:hypothetical protein
MQCNGIREQITSNPGFRKLHPGYGPPASSRSLLSKRRMGTFRGGNQTLLLVSKGAISVLAGDLSLRSKEKQPRLTFEMEVKIELQGVAPRWPLHLYPDKGR